jgi:hypothetical protein
LIAKNYTINTSEKVYTPDGVVALGDIGFDKSDRNGSSLLR